jgi:hypothetical protein
MNSRDAPDATRNRRARHRRLDYDEHATRAIAILGKVDECLLIESARRFTRAPVFVAVPLPA